MTVFVSAWPLILHMFLFAFLFFSFLWVLQVVRRDAGVVDIGWTVGVGVMAVYAAVAGDGWLPRRVLVAMLGGAWAFRLATYILVDRVLRPGEDGRYQYLRAHWGEKANSRFFFFFTMQSFLVILFGLPFLPIAADTRARLCATDVLGALVWVVAIAGESIADRQLTLFRRDPANKGKTCRVGLWRTSRHPNYFFEWLHWWAYVVVAIGAPSWWLTLVGPILMYVFLMRLTGIPYTEKRALASRGEDYRDYQQVTSKFFPMPPKKPGR